ncbi:hypothetical protein D3C80_2078410 [compost metagenome]
MVQAAPVELHPVGQVLRQQFLQLLGQRGDLGLLFSLVLRSNLKVYVHTEPLAVPERQLRLTPLPEHVGHAHL